MHNKTTKSNENSQQGFPNRVNVAKVIIFPCFSKQSKNKIKAIISFTKSSKN